MLRRERQGDQPRERQRGRRWARRIGWHLSLAVPAFLMGFPILWAILSSFRPANRVYQPSFDTAVTVANYHDALVDFPLGRLLLNSLVMSTGVTVLQLAVASAGAWALIRFPIRLRGAITAAVSAALVIPPQAIMVPHFLALVELGWRNTYLGLIVPQLSGCALAVLLLRLHVRAIPATVLASAAVDGATEWEVFRRIGLPLLRPALGAVAVLVFIGTWNEYLWPLLAAPRLDHATIQVGLALFTNQEGANPGPLLAAAVLTALPILAVYLAASRRIVDAFLHSGLRKP